MIDFKILFGKYIYIMAAVAVFGVGGLFAYLEIQGLQVTCEDKLCLEGVECSIHCEIYNPTYQSKYLYNYGDWPLSFTPEIEDVDIYVKYYGKWRYTNFTNATRLPNIPDKRKYAFVFPKRATKYFRINVTLNSTKIIKWDFGTLDPYIIGYTPVYQKKQRNVPVYKNVSIQVISEYIKENDTWTKAYNYTTVEIDKYEIENYDTDKIGYEIDGKEYIGYNNIKNNSLIIWDVPIGDRNFEEFGECRDFEMEKGICQEIDILKVLIK